MPDFDDKQFEGYLKGFRPVEPEPLPLRIRRQSAGTRRSALAASVVGCLAVAALAVIVLSDGRNGTTQLVASQPLSDTIQISGSSNRKRVEMPAIALTRLALDDHAAFEQFMTDKTQSQFPPMNTERSALRILAKQ